MVRKMGFNRITYLRRKEMNENLIEDWKEYIKSREWLNDIEELKEFNLSNRK